MLARKRATTAAAAAAPARWRGRPARRSATSAHVRHVALVLVLRLTRCVPRRLRRDGGQSLCDEAPPARLDASRVGDDNDYVTETTITGYTS